jgi:hypothetical protein
LACAPPKPRSAHPIERHPPERHRQRHESAVVYSCCCCCCCCLHTVGGVIGALAAGGYERQPGDKNRPVYPSSQSVFWVSFLVTVGLSAIAFAVKAEAPRPIAGFLFLLLFVGPLFLLGASFVMLVWLLFWLLVRRGRHDQRQYWRELGRITIGVIIGSVAGTVVMVIPFLLMSLLRG